MRITKGRLKEIINEEVRRLSVKEGEAPNQHLEEMEALQQSLLTLSYDLIDKLGGSSEIQEAQSYMQDAARAVHGAMESIRYSLEQQGLSERTHKKSK